MLKLDRKKNISDAQINHTHVGTKCIWALSGTLEIPVYERGLVLVIWRAFIACCCFSRAANMSPKSNWTGVLLFFPAAFDKASYNSNMAYNKYKEMVPATFSTKRLLLLERSNRAGGGQGATHLKFFLFHAYLWILLSCCKCCSQGLLLLTFCTLWYRGCDGNWSLDYIDWRILW